MKLNQAFKVLSVVVLLALAANTVSAQAPEGGDRQRRGGGEGGPGGGFDMAEMQKRISERMKEQLEITDEAEWKAIEPMVTKVNEARFAAMAGGRSFGGRGGRSGPGGGDAPANPAADALKKAIDAKASNAETKAAVEKFVAARKAKQAELEKAQAALRKVLTPRQEAIATLNGLL